MIYTCTSNPITIIEYTRAKNLVVHFKPSCRGMLHSIVTRKIVAFGEHAHSFEFQSCNEFEAEIACTSAVTTARGSYNQTPKSSTAVFTELANNNGAHYSCSEKTGLAISS